MAQWKPMLSASGRTWVLHTPLAEDDIANVHESQGKRFVESSTCQQSWAAASSNLFPACATRVGPSNHSCTTT
eukprot:1562095-Amphidinium_carterae.1